MTLAKSRPGPRLVGLVILLLAAAAPARSQTADEVVEKTLAALGGREALGKLTSRVATGSISVSTPAGDLPGTIQVWNQAPNKSRTLITLDLTSLGADRATVDQRFDGTAGYAMDSMRGNSDITGTQLENMRNNAFPTPLLSYKERGTTVELAGKQKVGDRDAYVLVFTPKSGPPSRQFFDAETYLPIRAIVTLELPEVGKMEQTSDFSDFREVDGVKMPFKIKGTSAVQTIAVTITKVENNVAVDPSFFVKPADK